MSNRVWDAHAKQVRKEAKKVMSAKGWNKLAGHEREQRWLEARAAAEGALSEGGSDVLG